MPFDVAGARKAGYSDAEIAAHLAKASSFDLAGAKKSGYSDGEVIAHLSAPGSSADLVSQIPGQTVKAPPAAQPVATAPTTIGDQVIGAGETALTLATGATGGSLGMLGGTLKGLAEQILSGKFGTAEAANAVERAAAEGSQALTYAPRTQAGQEQVQAVGGALQNLIPVAGIAPSLPVSSVKSAAPAKVTARAGIEGVARDIAGAPGAAVAAKAIDRVASLADNATTLPRRALQALKKEPEATAGTRGSVGAAGTDAAAQRIATAEGLDVPVQLTKGQATRDPAQLKFEVETSKLPEAGAPLRQRLVETNEKILQNMDAWFDQTGAEAPNLRAVGQSVDNALVKQATADKAAIRAAYKAAETAGELEAPVSIRGVIEHLNESAPDAATAPLLDVARRRAVQLGLAVERDGQLIPIEAPLKNVETFRQAISRATDYEATNIRQSTIIRGLVDEATDGLGGNLYKQARALRSRYAQNYENRAAVSKLTGTKRGTADRQVAFEDVLDHAILKGSLDDVRNVRRVLQRSGPEGAQAWKELQGGTLQWIKGEATKNIATDATGNRVLSPAGLDKAIRSLDHDGRLEFIFGKQGAQKLRDINEISMMAKTVPPEAAVNMSNTAATLLTSFADIGGSVATGIPAPIATASRLVLRHIKDAKLKARVADALNEAPAVQRAGETLH